MHVWLLTHHWQWIEVLVCLLCTLPWVSVYMNFEGEVCHLWGFIRVKTFQKLSLNFCGRYYKVIKIFSSPRHAWGMSYIIFLSQWKPIWFHSQYWLIRNYLFLDWRRRIRLKALSIFDYRPSRVNILELIILKDCRFKIAQLLFILLWRWIATKYRVLAFIYSGRCSHCKLKSMCWREVSSRFHSSMAWLFGRNIFAIQLYFYYFYRSHLDFNLWLFYFWFTFLLRHLPFHVSKVSSALSIYWNVSTLPHVVHILLNASS